LKSATAIAGISSKGDASLLHYGRRRPIVARAGNYDTHWFISAHLRAKNWRNGDKNWHSDH